MNKTLWQNHHGLKAIFRHGFVYLYSPALKDAELDGCTVWMYTRPIHNGDWMLPEFDDLKKWDRTLPSLAQLADFQATWRLCYCSSLPGTCCDYCGQSRSALQYIFPEYGKREYGLTLKDHGSRSAKSQPTFEWVNTACDRVQAHERDNGIRRQETTNAT